MRQKIGMVTIGQTPRSDIMPGMRQIIGDAVEVVEKGALDGLSLQEIQTFGPENGMTTVVTRLTDGAQVALGKEKIIPRIQANINELNEEGVDLIVVLCTGHLPRFESQCLLMRAQKVVDQCVGALINEHDTLGVLVPIPEQMAPARRNHMHITQNVVAASASPYGSVEELARAAETFEKNHVDLVVMHCMGFTNDHRSAVRRACPAPVVLANSIVARTAAELIKL